MTSSWPSAPLIRITKGSVYGSSLDGKLAVRAPHGGYGTDTHFLPKGYPAAHIDAWEEVTPVPTAALKRRREAAQGVDMPRWMREALYSVTLALPADNPSPLAQAATRVKDITGTPMIDAETLPADRLSLLLDALASIQSATRKTNPLIMVARICVDWADTEGTRSDSLEVMRRRIEVLSDTGDFIILSALVGDVTTTMREDFSPRHDLIDAGAYALAWAAQTIKEEDK